MNAQLLSVLILALILVKLDGLKLPSLNNFSGHFSPKKLGLSLLADAMVPVAIMCSNNRKNCASKDSRDSSTIIASAHPPEPSNRMKLMEKLFRYLAFTSDFGEALRPVLSAKLVSASYQVVVAYCLADLLWEVNKLKQRGYLDPQGNHKMSITQCVVERGVFHFFGTLIIPMLFIHQCVHVAHHACHVTGKFTTWGPSVVGIAVIPALPLYIDGLVEKAVETAFHHVGPWAKKHHNDEEEHDKKLL